jgi:prevent-host-death family protein
MRDIHVRPVRDLRNNYPQMESLLDNHDQVILTKHGRGTAVLINFEDYTEIAEYTHYKYVEEKLREAEAESAKPTAKWLDTKTVIRKLRKKYNA